MEIKDYRIDEVGYWNLLDLMADYTQEIFNMGTLINTNRNVHDIEGYTWINYAVYIPNSEINNFIETTKKVIELFNCWLNEKNYKFEDIFNKEIERELKEGTNKAHAYSIACFNHITQMNKHEHCLDLLEVYNPVFWDLECVRSNMEYDMDTYKRK